MLRSERAWGSGLVAFLVMAFVAVIVLMLGGCSTTSSAAAETTNPRVPINAFDLQAEEFKALVERCGDSFDTSSLVKPTSDDATDYVLRGEGKAVKSFDDYRCTVMRNPTVGFMLADGFQNIKTPPGETIGALNPWMGEFIEKSSGEHGLSAWLEKDGSGNLYVTQDYQHYAFNFQLLLSQFKQQGVMQATAMTHYPLEAMGIGVIPKTAMSNDPYQGEFIVLAYTQKGRTCPFMRIGINTFDGRFAILDNQCGATGKAPAPKPEPPRPQPPQPVPGGGNQPPADPPAPGQTPPSIVPPPNQPPPLELKQPDADPAPRGNAGNGGGVDQNPGPGTYVPPQEMQRPPAQQPAPQPAPQPKVVVPDSGTKVTVPDKPVDTSSQVNDGFVPTSPQKPGTACNPDFQDC